jgi:hypothetical protein
MKFSTQITLFALALGASARLQPPSNVVRSPPSLVERDLATVTSVIADVDTGIKALDKEVNAFSGDNSALDKAAENLISIIKAGTSKISSGSDLSLSDALALQSVVTGLQGDADTLVSDLSSKKSAFEEAALCSTLRQQTTDISTASKALIAAVVSKVPEAAQEIAKELASGVTKSLDKSQAEFAEGSCVDKSGGGGGGGSTSDGGSSPTSGAGETSGAPTGAPTTGASEPAQTGYPTTSAGAGTTAAPTPTGGNGTGGYPTTSAVVTAGAAVVAGPVGAVMMAVAAALL